MEMIKGFKGLGYNDTLSVPIINNTPHEHELKDSMADAIKKNPDAVAVLVRNHGVYVWGDTWAEAKTHAECLEYLFQVVIEMKRLNITHDQTNRQ
mmetsp:Transcript_8902/g.13506  ORF Transcript_8902/g.13506 Transcript_8902/m.13506 type:complete len:95 (+) Transcript_8902:388-672(+)